MSERIPDPPAVFRDNYFVREVYDRDPLSGMPSSKPGEWLVKDFYGATVCTCTTEHNAKLIARLLNRGS